MPNYSRTGTTRDLHSLYLVVRVTTILCHVLAIVAGTVVAGTVVAVTIMMSTAYSCPPRKVLKGFKR